MVRFAVADSIRNSESSMVYHAQHININGKEWKVYNVRWAKWNTNQAASVNRTGLFIIHCLFIFYFFGDYVSSWIMLRSCAFLCIKVNEWTSERANEQRRMKEKEKPLANISFSLFVNHVRFEVNSNFPLPNERRKKKRNKSRTWKGTHRCSIAKNSNRSHEKRESEFSW